jgi:hypothetical protein
MRFHTVWADFCRSRRAGIDPKQALSDIYETMRDFIVKNLTYEGSRDSVAV